MKGEWKYEHEVEGEWYDVTHGKLIVGYRVEMVMRVNLPFTRYHCGERMGA